MYDDVFSNNDVVFDIGSDIVTFFSSDVGLNCINRNNINLDDDNFYNFDLKLLIM